LGSDSRLGDNVGDDGLEEGIETQGEEKYDEINSY